MRVFLYPPILKRQRFSGEKGQSENDSSVTSFGNISSEIFACSSAVVAKGSEFIDLKSNLSYTENLIFKSKLALKLSQMQQKNKIALKNRSNFINASFRQIY